MIEDFSLSLSRRTYLIYTFIYRLMLRGNIELLIYVYSRGLVANWFWCGVVNISILNNFNGIIGHFQSWPQFIWIEYSNKFGSTQSTTHPHAHILFKRNCIHSIHQYCCCGDHLFGLIERKQCFSYECMLYETLVSLTTVTNFWLN